MCRTTWCESCQETGPDVRYRHLGEQLVGTFCGECWEEIVREEPEPGFEEAPGTWDDEFVDTCITAADYYEQGQ